MRLTIRGHHLPGRRTGPYDDVHVGIQVGREPAELVRADVESAEWVTDIEVRNGDFLPRCARLRAPALTFD
jgi:hypothetical protein